MQPIWLIVAAIVLVWTADLAVPRWKRRGSRPYIGMLGGALGLLVFAYIAILT